MAEPMPQQGRRPLRGISVVPLPPATRSRKARLLIPVAGRGRFDLPACTRCGAFAWPVPEACPACLSPDLPLSPAPRGGRVISFTTAEVPVSGYFRVRAPWRVGLVEMDCGPRALVHLHPACDAGGRVRLTLMLDRAGQAVLHAGPETEEDMGADPQWQEMTCDPKGRRVLITHARHAAALPLAQALLAAGAAQVWLGLDEDGGLAPQIDGLPGVEIVLLDPRSDRSVDDLAREIGGKVDILVNTADLPRPGPQPASSAPMQWRETMELVAFGLMRLMRAFAPPMASRGGDGAVAWVNMMSVMARVPHPGFAGYAAAHAAALAQTPALRALLAPGGIRLLTAFAGPTEGDRFDHFPAPRVAGHAIAAEITAALKAGLEEAVIGELARGWLRRQDENPRALEADLARGQF